METHTKTSKFFSSPKKCFRSDKTILLRLIGCRYKTDESLTLNNCYMSTHNGKSARSGREKKVAKWSRKALIGWLSSINKILSRCGAKRLRHLILFDLGQTKQTFNLLPFPSSTSLWYICRDDTRICWMLISVVKNLPVIYGADWL